MDKTPKNKRITALNVFFQTFTTMNVTSHGKAVTRPTNGFGRVIIHTQAHTYFMPFLCAFRRNGIICICICGDYNINNHGMSQSETLFDISHATQLEYTGRS